MPKPARERRVPSPSCGRTHCMYHRFEPCVSDVMMRRAFALIIGRNYEPVEYFDLRDMCNGMG